MLMDVFLILTKLVLILGIILYVRFITSLLIRCMSFRNTKDFISSMSFLSFILIFSFLTKKLGCAQLVL